MNLGENATASVAQDEHWCLNFTSDLVNQTTTSKVIKVGGYAADGDGGHATYEYSPTKPAHEMYQDRMAGGYWVPFGEITFKQCGAKGDGVTDDTVAAQRALTAAARIAKTKGSCTLHITAGEYLISSVIEETIDAPVTAGEKFHTGLTIVGDGPFTTKIALTTDNDEGFLKLTANQTRQFFNIKDLSVHSYIVVEDETNPPNDNGRGIELRTGYAPSFINKQQVEISNVHFVPGGASGSTTKRGLWKDCIYIRGLCQPVVHDCWFNGTNYSNTNITGDATTSLSAITFEECYGSYAHHNYVNDWFRRGLWFWDPRTQKDGPEGVTCTANVVVNCLDGIVVQHDFNTGSYDRGEPGAVIAQNHVNNRRYGIRLYHHAEVQIFENYCYQTREDRNITGIDNPSVVYVESANYVKINDNMFSDMGYYNADDDCSCSILIEDRDAADSNLNIDNFQIFMKGNTFIGNGIRIYNKSTGSNITSDADIFVDSTNEPTATTHKDWVDLTGALNVTNAIRHQASGANLRAIVEDYTGRTPAAFASFEHNIRALRSDYGSKSNATLSSQVIYGNTSTGTEKAVTGVSNRFISNTDGSEIGTTEFYTLRSDVYEKAMDFGSLADVWGPNIPPTAAYMVANSKVIDGDRTIYPRAVGFASLGSANPAGQMVVVTDRNYRPVISDGTDWRFADGTIAA
ncbi:glycosyl hydrolase family 28-related protein [Jiella marina]|uniref:glycosyl hydrolase family 28-related protein n=1 Tax=Jiella sp. LLJ827 TaxID=2917712 RepID=UPI00210193B2|nr:glycosyl hydrolase family 28-related protein [Jiella sp. LLJ827]MCQ0988138.1 hypothetical protein [Jiella sp. LLJ827]